MEIVKMPKNDKWFYPYGVKIDDNDNVHGKLLVVCNSHFEAWLISKAVKNKEDFTASIIHTIPSTSDSNVLVCYVGDHIVTGKQIGRAHV